MKISPVLLFLSTMMISAIVKAQTEYRIDLQWSLAASLPMPSKTEKHPGLAGMFAGISDHVLVVAGGSDFPYGMPWQGGKKKYWDNVYVFRKTARGYKSLPSGDCSLPKALAYGASVTVPEGIVLLGGENETGPSKDVLLLKWNSKKRDIEFTSLPDLDQALTNASAVKHGRVIYLAGGETMDSVSDRYYSLDLDQLNKGWQPLPHLPRPVSHAVMVVQSYGDQSCIYLLGGRCKKNKEVSEFYDHVYQFNLKTKVWTEKKSMPYALSAGTGMDIGNQKILLFGGDRGETFHQVEKLQLSILSEKNETTKQELINKKNTLLATHPGFSREVWSYDTAKNDWSLNSILPFETPVTTTIVKWNNQLILPGGEIKAGIRSPRIWSAHFKSL